MIISQIIILERSDILGRCLFIDTVETSLQAEKQHTGEIETWY